MGHFWSSSSENPSSPSFGSIYTNYNDSRNLTPKTLKSVPPQSTSIIHDRFSPSTHTLISSGIRCINYKSVCIPIDSWNCRFFYTIFQWKTEWFENQNDDQPTPSILGDEYRLRPTSESYSDFEDYVQTMEPLMVHEFFYALLKDIEENDDDLDVKDSKARPRKLTGTVHRCKTDTLDISTSRKIKKFVVMKRVKKNEEYNFPIQGDLLHVNYDGRYKIFGYVDNVDRVIIYPEKDLVFIFTVFTKDFDIQENQEITLSTVKTMQQDLRILRALKCLPVSPLVKSILKPSYVSCDMECSYPEIKFPFSSSQINLNSKQIKIVAGIKQSVENSKPKICLVQGPPGTGKSSTITATILELMKEKKNRILLCAQSNKAVDSVLLKLLNMKSIIERLGLKIVRIGRDDKMDPGVNEVALSTLSSGQQMNNLSLSEKKTLKQHRIEEQILANADIIVSTLSSCYTYKMEKNFGKNGGKKIPICIIDEAGQSTEVSTLVPLMLGVKTLVLVGDPQQLTPTIISAEAEIHGMDVSFFARVQNFFKMNLPTPIQMLDVQYRMVDPIAYWPNKYFYQGKIHNAAKIQTFPLVHYKVLNHNFHQSDKSFTNLPESRIIVNLLEIIIPKLLEMKTIEEMPSIGVITPYHDQRHVIYDMMKEVFRRIIHILQKVHSVNTDSLSLDTNVTDQRSKPIARRKNNTKRNGYRKYNIKNKEAIDNMIKKKSHRIDTLRQQENSVITEPSLLDTNDDSQGPKRTARKNIKYKSMNKEQLQLIYGQLEKIEVNTVDSFQGQERDIIIMSCVRSRGIGFVADPNRLNVSLTRARHTMILCGHFDAFRGIPGWQDLLDDAELRNAYVNIPPIFNQEILKNLIFQ